MKILAVSDKESRFIWDHFDPEAFKGVELIISCGDLKAKYLSFLVTMIPAPLFYVPGNHDKDYIAHPPDGCVSIDNKLIEYKGVRLLGFGGCLSDGVEPYEVSECEMWKRVKKMSGEIKRRGAPDILVTHAPALGLGDGRDAYHRGFEAFRYINETHHPKLHVFGHCHTNASPVDPRSVFTFGGTTLVNATGYRLLDFPPVAPGQKPSGGKI